MKSFSRESWLGLGLLIVLMGATAVSIIQESQRNVRIPPLASHSNTPNGTRALTLYLEETGYEIETESVSDFQIPENVDLMLLLEPTTSIIPAEWETIDTWVDAGGTLLIAGRGLAMPTVLNHYDSYVAFGPRAARTVHSQLPIFQSPPLTQAAQLQAGFGIESDHEGAVVLFAREDGLATAVTFPQGNGRVLLTNMTEPFTNVGLQTAGNIEWVMNLISSAADGRTVWFDEWHHGEREAAASSGNWLQKTPTGNAILFVAAVLFINMLLRGRNFGRPVPLQKALSRRAPLEYISSIANMSRRAGHRTALLQDYHARLKRDLGSRYRLNPTLPDAEFVERLAKYNPNMETAVLQALLQKLSQTNLSEAEMVQTVAQATQFVKNTHYNHDP